MSGGRGGRVKRLRLVAGGGDVELCLLVMYAYVFHKCNSPLRMTRKIQPLTFNYNQPTPLEPDSDRVS